jgi:exonuclease SbcC
MFTRIQYKVRFEPQGRPPVVFNRDLEFNGGLTAIIGPNEKGKSLTLEMMRFLWFGSKALRGVSSDYKGLEVLGWFMLNGVDYHIKRTMSDAHFYERGELKARGTTPVNNRFLEMVGFGLKVFDVANSINQGAVEALSDMRPTERQRMVGSVVGLDKLESLMDFAAKEALALDREATSVEKTLVRPTAPEIPEGYPNRGVLADFLTGAERDELELARLLGVLAAPGIPEPTHPGDRPVPLSEGELELLIAENQEIQRAQRELANLPVIDVPAAQAALTAFEDYEAAKATVAKIQQKGWALTPDGARFALDHWDLYDQWSAFEERTQARLNLGRQINAANKVTCPSCDHQFPLNQAEVTRLEQQLEQLPVIPQPEGDAPPKPSVSRAAAQSLLDNLEAYQADMAELALAQERIQSVPPRPLYSRFDLDNYDPDRRGVLEQALAGPQGREGAEAELVRLREWLIRSETYEEQAQRYEEYKVERAALQAKAKELEYAPARVAELRPLMERIRLYDVLKAEFDAQLATYEATMADLALTREKAEKWRAARIALVNLRTMVKQHLYPSLAHAASVLLAGMTSGRRNSIEIDDEFNVLVDGQRLDTLSGSAKAVANLSIRMGLGRVLTHQSLPVIFADEIDGSMDDERAEATQDILRQCARQVSQFLLVTHKTPDADHVIDLGELGC